MFIARKYYLMLTRVRRGWWQATKKYIGGYRSRVSSNRIVITIICITITCFVCFILYSACTLWHPWGGWWFTARRRIGWHPLLALIIFDISLALEVLQFATLLVVVVVHPELVAATGKFSRELWWCLKVLFSNKLMFEDVTLHILFPVFHFRVRLLLRDIRRNIWGEFISVIALDIPILIILNLERFSSVFFSRLSLCHPHISSSLRGGMNLIYPLVDRGAISHFSRMG